MGVCQRELHSQTRDRLSNVHTREVLQGGPRKAPLLFCAAKQSVGLPPMRGLARTSFLCSSRLVFRGWEMVAVQEGGPAHAPQIRSGCPTPCRLSGPDAFGFKKFAGHMRIFSTRDCEVIQRFSLNRQSMPVSLDMINVEIF